MTLPGAPLPDPPPAVTQRDAAPTTDDLAGIDDPDDSGDLLAG